MNKINNFKFYICIAIISVVSLFWLVSPLFRPEAFKGTFQQNDPDSLLFARHLEQSLLKGRILTTDSYGAFPYEVKTGFAPFYMYFLVNFVNLAFFILPNLSLDPMYVAAILPLAIPWLTSILLIFSIFKLSKNRVLALFCALCILPGFSWSMVSSFYKLDYDFLISFFIWAWIICSIFYIKTEKHIFVYIASAITVLFLSTWLGTPLFYAFATLYALVLWLINPNKNSDYISFTSASMLIGGIVAILFVDKSDDSLSNFINGNISSYSCLQGSVVVIGGLFLALLNKIKEFYRPRLLALLSFVSTAFLIVLLKPETLLQLSGFLLKRDPIHFNIGELSPSVFAKGLINQRGVFEEFWLRFTPLILFFPLCFSTKFPEKSEKYLVVLKGWLFIFLILTLYQVRYIRWVGSSFGLINGIALYFLYNSIKNGFDSYKFSNPKIVLTLIPIIALSGISNYMVISQPSNIGNDLTDALKWIQENTPAVSGYSDNKAPEYGILSYWSIGNYISFYAKRPTVVSNSMWGYRTMADVFSSIKEEEALKLCNKYKIKYILIEPPRNIEKNILNYWQVLKKMPEVPEYTLYYKDIPNVEKTDEYFYYWLSQNLALTNLGNFEASNNFRLVYSSENAPNTISNYILFECVKGASLSLSSEPNSEISVSIEIKLDNLHFLYKRSIVTDENGNGKIRLPYSTSYKKGRITTDDFYKLSIQNGKNRRLAKLVVPEEAIINGTTLEEDRHINYLSTFE